jgi:hypothetical protein
MSEETTAAAEDTELRSFLDSLDPETLVQLARRLGSAAKRADNALSYIMRQPRGKIAQEYDQLRQAEALSEWYIVTVNKPLTFFNNRERRLEKGANRLSRADAFFISEWLKQEGIYHTIERAA